MMLLVFIALQLCVCAVSVNRSIFLLGDSVSQRLYKDGLTPLFDCNEVDPTIAISVETSPHYLLDKGRMCTKYGVTRIGYMLHYGVFNPPNHDNWVSHRPVGGTENSRDNIKMAMKEFQNRTSGTSDKVYFIILSSLWDIHRYHENKHLYKNMADWEDHYQDMYTSLLLELRPTLRPQDQIVICLMHKVNYVDTLRLNERALRVARHLRIPVFDEAYILGPEPSIYLFDHAHQTPHASYYLAQEIRDGNFRLVPEEATLAKDYDGNSTHPFLRSTTHAPR